ncbi:uncharacterized protein DS421_10g309420 [Arachis hypogaea]|nr:uncharacterized protein DS421_10g309420 [Arachis hypogaea]
MIETALYFWNKTTNSFHLLYGMVSPTLFDVTVIIGLLMGNPVGTFDMNSNKKYSIIEKNSYEKFIKHNMGKENNLATEDEYVAFLYYWSVIFYSKSVSMQKLFITLAALLHEGHKFNLAKLLLGNLLMSWGKWSIVFEKRLQSVHGALLATTALAKCCLQKTHEIRENYNFK